MTDQTRTEGATGESADLFDLLGEDGEQFRKKEPEPKPEDLITEGAKKKAEELKIELKEVKGSGKGGRVLARDVQKVATERAREKAREKAAAGTKEPDVYDKDRVVLYAGHRFEVPSRTMKLEEIRSQMLENRFPELSKERTEMLYDEERGHVIPVLKGHRKGGGYTERPMQVHRGLPTHHEALAVYHVLGDDGVYEVRTTQTGTFVAKIETGRKVKEGFVLKAPKVPAELFRAVVERFAEEPETELLAYFVLDYWEGYHLVWPEQDGSASHVEAEGEVETEERFVVLQVHSHGTLPAFFSATDDADEVRTGLYGVVGRVHYAVPEVKFRYSCGGIYRAVDPGEIFEGDLGDVYVRRSSSIALQVGGNGTL